MRKLLLFICGFALLLSVSKAGSGGKSLIVSMKDPHGLGRINNANKTRTVAQIPNSSVYLLRTENDDDNNNLDQVLANIRQDGSVDSAEPNTHFKMSATDQPSTASPALAESMADLLDGNAVTTFYGTNVLKAYATQPALDVIHATDVRSTSSGAATRVGYIDTGVDPDHPALKPWLDPGVDVIRGGSVSEFDGLSESMADLLDESMADLLDHRFTFILNSLAPNGGQVPAAFGHGTMVAGLIHVVAPQARIVPIKAFDEYGNTSIYAIIQGVYAAIDANVDVLNMSFSTTTDSPALHKALDSAKASGIVLVAAVGNEAQETPARYPAAYNAVYGVAATDNNDRLAGFSNYGSTVSLDAPGAGVISTAPGGRYAMAWGTSFSSPIVSGSMALVASMRSHGQSTAPRIKTTADSIDLKNPGFESKLGTGRINLQQAFKNLK